MPTLTRYLRLNDVNDLNEPSDPLVWGSATLFGTSNSVDSGSDGLLDAGTDSFPLFGTPYPFTGHTVEFQGETYAIFYNGVDYIIPFDNTAVDLSPLGSGGTSTGYTPTGA